MITVSVRHFNSLSYIEKLAELSERYVNFGLNLVAGNSLYLTEKEQKRPIAKLLERAVKLATKKFKENEIFTGTEGVINVISKLATKYEIVPFLLMDKNLKEKIEKIKVASKNGLIAVYTPFFILSQKNANPHGITQLTDYVLRRKWVRKYLTKEGYNINQIQKLFEEKGKNSNTKYQSAKKTLLRVFKELSIFGDIQAVSRSLERLKEASIIVGFPLREEENQIISFVKCFRRKLSA